MIGYLWQILAHVSPPEIQEWEAGREQRAAAKRSEPLLEHLEPPPPIDSFDHFLTPPPPDFPPHTSPYRETRCFFAARRAGHAGGPAVGRPPEPSSLPSANRLFRRRFSALSSKHGKRVPDP